MIDEIKKQKVKFSDIKKGDIIHSEFDSKPLIGRINSITGPFHSGTFQCNFKPFLRTDLIDSNVYYFLASCPDNAQTKSDFLYFWPEEEVTRYSTTQPIPRLIHPDQLAPLRDSLLLRGKVGDFAAQRTIETSGSVPYLDATRGAYNKGFDEALQLLYAAAPSLKPKEEKK